MHWASRKEALAEEWESVRRKLPEHVQSVLGPRKNILLLREMLEAAGSPDVSLVDCLLQGFPLGGQFSRSGTLPAIEYNPGAESIAGLRENKQAHNATMIARVAVMLPVPVVAS